MKTVQFNANNILCGNNYPIAYYYPMAKDLVVISTGHDDSIIDDSIYFISGLTRQYYNDTCLTLYAISCYSCLDSYIQISLT